MLKFTLVVAAILLITVASQPMPQQVNVVVNGVKIPIGQPGNQGNGQEDTTTKKTDFWTPTPGHPQASSGVFMVYDKRSTPAPVAYQPRHPGNQGNGQEDNYKPKPQQVNVEVKVNGVKIPIGHPGNKKD